VHAGAHGSERLAKGRRCVIDSCDNERGLGKHGNIEQAVHCFRRRARVDNERRVDHDATQPRIEVGDTAAHQGVDDDNGLCQRRSRVVELSERAHTSNQNAVE
jgi:hypothetical protein